MYPWAIRLREKGGGMSYGRLGAGMAMGVVIGVVVGNAL